MAQFVLTTEERAVIVQYVPEDQNGDSTAWKLRHSLLELAKFQHFSRLVAVKILPEKMEALWLSPILHFYHFLLSLPYQYSRCYFHPSFFSNHDPLRYRHRTLVHYHSVRKERERVPPRTRSGRYHDHVEQSDEQEKDYLQAVASDRLLHCLRHAVLAPTMTQRFESPEH